MQSRARSKEFRIILKHIGEKSVPIVRRRNSGRLNVPTEDVVDEARLARAVVAQNKHKRHLRRLITTRVQFLQRPVHVVVERLDESCVKVVAPIHDLGLHLAVKGGQCPA